MRVMALTVTILGAAILLPSAMATALRLEEDARGELTRLASPRAGSLPPAARPGPALP